jgi:hypothetical protein
MGTRSFVALAALFVLELGLGSPRPAAADPKSDIAQKSKEGMESYDLMDYDGAKKHLAQALAIAKRAKLEKDPVAAKLYLSIGLAAFAGGDPDGAKVAFIAAVQIEPKIQIAPEYRQPALAKLLELARSEASSTPVEPAGLSAIDCAGVIGVQHTIIDAGKRDASAPIEALIGGEIQPAKVSVMYRPEGATAFIENRLIKQGQCKYIGTIPASGMKGAVVHYYVAAYDANNRVIAGKGSSGSPNIMELTSERDGEDPINGGGSVTGGGKVAAKPAKMYAGLAFGTGVSYVTGKTEFDNTVENCCLGSSLAVITPEFGYYVNPQLTVGLAVRLGIPVGANLEGHSTLAPGGVVRVRYALAPSGDGLRVIGQLGAGILRNTIKLNNVTTAMNTDIVAQGPLLVGAGVGYTRRLAGNIALVADLSLLGAIAVVKKIGTTPNLNSGVAGDLSVGVAVGF